MAHRRSGARRYPIKHHRHTEQHIPAVMTKKYRPQPWNVPQQCLHCGLLCSCRSNGAARSAQATFDPHTDNTPQQHGTIAQPPHHMGRTDQNHVSAWSHKGAIALGLHYSNPIRMWDQACLSFLWTWHTLFGGYHKKSRGLQQLHCSQGVCTRYGFNYSTFSYLFLLTGLMLGR